MTEIDREWLAEWLYDRYCHDERAMPWHHLDQREKQRWLDDADYVQDNGRLMADKLTS